MAVAAIETANQKPPSNSLMHALCAPFRSSNKVAGKCRSVCVFLVLRLNRTLASLFSKRRIAAPPTNALGVTSSYALTLKDSLRCTEDGRQTLTNRNVKHFVTTTHSFPPTMATSPPLSPSFLAEKSSFIASWITGLPPSPPVDTNLEHIRPPKRKHAPMATARREPQP
jgi:hypothetical protein